MRVLALVLVFVPCAFDFDFDFNHFRSWCCPHGIGIGRYTCSRGATSQSVPAAVMAGAALASGAKKPAPAPALVEALAKR